MNSVLHLGGLSAWQLCKRVWLEIEKDDVLGRAAQLSYYFLLALFPLLIFLISLMGLIPDIGAQMKSHLMQYLAQVLPGAASALVNHTIEETTHASTGGTLMFGLLATLWAASNGMGAITSTLNIAYDVHEHRPWIKRRIVAIALTGALGVLVMAALLFIIYSARMSSALAHGYGYDDALAVFWRVLQWPMITTFMLLAFGLIYHFGPDFKDHGWPWVLPGSIVGVGLWVLFSIGFRTYLDYHNAYGHTYGSLEAVIVLMLWFYVTGAAILIGGEVNAEIEHAAFDGKPSSTAASKPLAASV
ncbi:MAG: putative rane protein [Acidobacteriales bacterium]|nr:putative rane protein [Terriglobales bacterium]